MIKSTNTAYPTGTNAARYVDVQFVIASGRVAAANFPDWEAFTANTSEYAFAVDDYIDLGANEVSHGWVEATPNLMHLHVTTKDANATGANRFAKFTAYLTYAAVGNVWQETSLTAELTIPTGTAALHHFLLSMGELALPTEAIGTQIKARIKRIAATGGTEYASHIFLTQFGAHEQIDADGSRSVAAK